VAKDACVLSIGPHRIRNNAFLAPMAGITDGPFRKLAERFGAGMVVSEMIASNALAVGNQQTQSSERFAAYGATGGLRGGVDGTWGTHCP
jgi:tRNA-dihydrouridine synthase